MPTNRGAEQGGVDGPLQCSMTPGVVSAEARFHVGRQQAEGIVPSVGASVNEDVQIRQDDYQNNMLLLQNLQPGGPEKKLSGTGDPRHALQECGILADFWCLDQLTLELEQRPQKLVKLGRGHSKGSFQDLQKIVPSKPPAGQVRSWV